MNDKIISWVIQVNEKIKSTENYHNVNVVFRKMITGSGSQVEVIFPQNNGKFLLHNTEDFTAPSNAHTTQQ